MPRLKFLQNGVVGKLAQPGALAAGELTENATSQAIRGIDFQIGGDTARNNSVSGVAMLRQLTLPR
jgi:hypothetical protein